MIQPTKSSLHILAELDREFMDGGLIKPVSQEYVDSIPWSDLRVYCHYRAIYTIVTHELVAFLSEKLLLSEGVKNVGTKGDMAIEIGSGNGTLSRSLNIKGTDNKMQQDPAVKLHYLMAQQPVIEYPEHVEKIDGIAAIKKYKPHTVLGSWITHKWRDEEPERLGNYWAPDEEEIMRLCERYVLIGNFVVHQNNRLFNSKKYNCEIYKPDCIRSRAKHPEQDAIFVFTKK